VESARALVLDVEVAGTGTDTVTTLLGVTAASGMAVVDVVASEAAAPVVLGLAPAAMLPLAAGLALFTMTAESMPIFAINSDTSNVVFR
jgi:hypothetical protein